MQSLLERLISQDYTLSGNSRYARSVEHNSLVVDRKKRIFFWNSKDLVGNAYTWLTQILGYEDSDARRLIEDEKEDLFLSEDFSDKDEVVPVPYPVLVDTFFEKGKNHRKYWYEDRGYTDKTIDNFKLGYTGFWYTIPIYVEGRFVNFQLRRANPKRIKYWYRDGGKHPFNFSALKLTDWVVLTEGPVDAIMLRQYDIPAVSQATGAGYWNTAWNKYFAHLKSIWIAYDNDMAGKASESWGMRAKIYTFDDYPDGFDVTDFFKKYKDDNPREIFLAKLETESKYYFEMEEWCDL